MRQFLRQYGYMGIIFGIWFLSFFPRVLSLDAHWSSDETLWMNRSRNFMLSLQNGEFSETLPAFASGWLVFQRVTL